MITPRPSAARGHLDHGWLDTYHTFSFNTYYDPAHMGFRALRVINEDYVAPGRGFGEHAHDNMEIVTVVLNGSLEHRDSMGNGEVLHPGEIQYMSAGTGIRHSEFNPASDQPLHLMQIWLLPNAHNLKPDYAQKPFPAEKRQDKLLLVASKDGRHGSITIHIRRRALRLPPRHRQVRPAQGGKEKACLGPGPLRRTRHPRRSPLRRRRCRHQR